MVYNYQTLFIMRHFLLRASFLLFFAISGCSINNPGPEKTGPEPEPPLTFAIRDSIFEGSYRAININSRNDQVFTVLEKYREEKLVSYLGAVNNFFSDVTDLKGRIASFDYLVLDEKSDTDTGVQIQLESGKVKSIKLNNGKILTQWPETANLENAIHIGDDSEIIYGKLVTLSKQNEYAHKFQRIVLSTKYTYALYDPVKASLPWTFIYSTQPDLREEVQIHFKDKKVAYILVNRFEKK